MYHCRIRSPTLVLTSLHARRIVGSGPTGPLLERRLTPVLRPRAPHSAWDGSHLGPVGHPPCGNRRRTSTSVRRAGRSYVRTDRPASRMRAPAGERDGPLNGRRP